MMRDLPVYELRRIAPPVDSPRPSEGQYEEEG